MHKTDAGERRKALKRQAIQLTRDARTAGKASWIIPEARTEAQRLSGAANDVLKEAESMKRLMRLEDLSAWQMNKDKETKKGKKTYTYWMASWREGDKVRNVHLGSSNKVDAEVARQKARRLKAEALGLCP